MHIQLAQRTIVQKIGERRWRVLGYVGVGLFFYAECGGEAPPHGASNEFTLADVGKWRAIDTRRHLIVGHGGKVMLAPKPEGAPGDFRVDFDGVRLEI